MKQQRKQYCNFWGNPGESYSKVARRRYPFYTAEGLNEYQDYIGKTYWQDYDYWYDGDTADCSQDEATVMRQYCELQKTHPPEIIPILMRMFG